MENLILNAEIRKIDETTKELKNSKMLAWVVYGKHKESISIKLDYSDFLKTFRKSGQSHIINLKVGKNWMEVLVHEIQHNPISGDFIHIDFYAITRWEALITHIPLNLIWNAPAIKEWAILEEHLKEIEVKCLPKDLVDSFEVDLSVLIEMWDSIKVSDLLIDTKKYEILTHINEIIVSATKPAKIKEELVTEEIITPEK